MTKLQAMSWLVVNVQDDEPVFILRGRDPLAPPTISFWIGLAKGEQVRPEKIDGALKVMEACLDWPEKKLPG